MRYIIFSCITLLLSCSIQTNNETTPTLLEMERQFIFNDKIGGSYGIIYDDGHYLISDTKPDNGKHFKILDKNFELISEFGEQGDSPDEIDGRPGYMPPMAFIKRGSFHFLGGFDLYKFSSQDNYQTYKVNLLEYPKQYHTPPQHYLVAQDSLLWVNGGSFRNRFFVFNLNSKEMIKEIPHLAELQNLERDQLIYGFNAHGVYDFNNQQVIWVYNYLNLIEIYTTEGDLKRSITFDRPVWEEFKPESFLPLNTFQNVLAFKNGFITWRSDRDQLASMIEFQIKNFEPDENDSLPRFKWLIVFDSEGNELGRIQIPDFTMFCINPDEELLVFTSNEREDYPIFTLPLPDLIKEIL